MTYTSNKREWAHHHTVAMCQDPTCSWEREYHGGDQHRAELVMRAAGDHSKRRNHYVQVERGQHRHYDARPV